LIVIDASAAVYAASAADPVFDDIAVLGPIAPPLLWSEAASALHQMMWRRAISGELASIALAKLFAAPIVRTEPDDLLGTAWTIATDLGWAKTYGAEYIALARIAGCRLLTRDERLYRTASRVVEVVGPSDL
jgi:predicted nucleic acid-binding protein